MKRTHLRSLLVALGALVVLAGCGSAIGDSCTIDGDCEGRSCFNGQAFAGGYCSMRCNLSDDSGCPTGATCVNHDGEAICIRDCTQDIECRSGYVCKSYRGAGSYCLTPGDD